MRGLTQKALANEDLAYAIVGQALLDEGSILTSNMEIFYNDENTARFLFAIAERWNMADNFRVKHALKQTKYGFTIRAHARHPIYERIGPLPDETKDIAFKHLLRDISTGPKYPQSVAKRGIVASLRRSPKTSRDLAYEFGLSGSTIKGHLKNLRDAGRVRIIGRNARSLKGKRKCAYVWETVPSK